MMAKTLRDFMQEANASVTTIDIAEGLRRHEAGEALFVDVREGHEWAQGHLPGALHAPRGFLEFLADPESPAHKAELASGRPLVIYCASGGRSALAAQRLREMGYDDVCNLGGGIQGWTASGGAIER